MQYHYVIASGKLYLVIWHHELQTVTRKSSCVNARGIPPCSEYSFCCPNWVPPPQQGTPILTWLGGGVPRLGWVPYLGTPQAGYPPPGLTWGVPYLGALAWNPPPGQGTPWQDTPPAGYPHPGPGRVPPPPAGPGRVPPLGVCPMAFWEMLQSIMGYGYPPCGQTDRHVSKHNLPVVLRTRAVII